MTVTVWDTFQFVESNVSVGPETVPSLSSLELIGMVTVSPTPGSDVSVTVNWAVWRGSFPSSVVVSPEVGVTTMPGTSSSTATGPTAATRYKPCVSFARLIASSIA